MSPKTKRRPIAARFWAKVAGGDVTTCWMWTGAANPRTGYGTFCIEKGKFVTPHRFAVEGVGRARWSVNADTARLALSRAVPDE